MGGSGLLFIALAPFLAILAILFFVLAVLADPWKSWVKRLYYFGSGAFGIVVGLLGIEAGYVIGRGGGKLTYEPAWYEHVAMCIGFWDPMSLLATIPGCVFVVVGAVFIRRATGRKAIVDYGTKPRNVARHYSTSMR